MTFQRMNDPASIIYAGVVAESGDCRLAVTPRGAWYLVQAFRDGVCVELARFRDASSVRAFLDKASDDDGRGLLARLDNLAPDPRDCWAIPFPSKARRAVRSAVGAPPSPPAYAVALLPNGRRAYQVAGYRGVPSAVFAARLDRGWTVERAAFEPMPRRRVSPVARPSLIRQVRLADNRLAFPVAASLGISEVTFRNRLRRGLSPDEATFMPLQSSKGLILSRPRDLRSPCVCKVCGVPSPQGAAASTVTNP